MAAVLGLSCKLYRNTGSYGSPTWNECTNIKDAEQSVSAGSWDASRRGVSWRQFLTTLFEGEVTFAFVYEPGDADYEAIRDAFFNRTNIDLAIMSGAIASAGSEGLRAEFAVTDFKRPEQLEEGLMCEFTVKPGFSSNAPVWLEVA